MSLFTVYFTVTLKMWPCVVVGYLQSLTSVVGIGLYFSSEILLSE